jgi:hypothetical protein
MKQQIANSKQRIAIVAAALALVGIPLALAQGISFGDAPSGAAKKGHVVMLSDGVSVAAGKAEYVELRFRVDEGYHINSHTPKDPLLIPTAVKLNDNAAVKVLGEEYPKGAPVKLGQGADAMTLDVYQGEFRVRVKVLADKGGQTLLGALHYQACDDASCFPPKTLALRVAVEAK